MWLGVEISWLLAIANGIYRYNVLDFSLIFFVMCCYMVVINATFSKCFVFCFDD